MALRVDPVLLGRVLLAFTAGLTALTVPMLAPASDAIMPITVVCSGVVLLLALSFLVPWAGLGARATIAFPVIVCVALVALSGSAGQAYSPLAGLLSLCFAYIGLTQPPRTTFVMLPVGATAFVLINGGWSAAVGLRLFIAACVWTILGEVLSGFTASQRKLSDALQAAAHTDVLTGVANRRDLDLRLDRTVPGDTVVLCDLDHFKRLNDTEGHHVGDRVLAEFGAMLHATLRANDYCARYGGEEFVLILPSTTAAEAAATLARLHANWSVLRPDSTFSAGIAVCSADQSHTETVGAADRALYAAKAAGRNCDRIAGASDQADPEVSPRGVEVAHPQR
jgi:diguanylate cyclase